MLGKENLEWNTDLVETMRLENLICQATQRPCTVTGLDTNFKKPTWIQQGTVEMPQLQSTDEVVEVPQPLREAVSIPVEALTSEARRDMEKKQKIYANIEMYDEAQRTGIDAQDVDKVTAQMADEQRDAKEAHKLGAKLKEQAFAMIKRDSATQLTVVNPGKV